MRSAVSKLACFIGFLACSSMAYGYGGEYSEKDVGTMNAQLNTLGFVVVCGSSEFPDEIDGATKVLNSKLSRLKGVTDVSTPTLQNGHQRSTSICVTVKKQK